MMFRKLKLSSGRLAISGRNAKENDILLNLNWHPNTVVLHTEAKGSPFVVIV